MIKAHFLRVNDPGFTMKIRVKLIIVALVLVQVGRSFPSAEKEDNEIELTNEGQGKPSKMRTKRDSVSFGAMIWGEIGRNPLDYNGYGCWCGLGGKGKTVDEIDRCCYVHDKCLDAVVDSGICGWLSKYTVYATFYWRSGCTGCVSWLNSECQNALCKCDGAAVRCFRDNDSKFKNKYQNYDKSTC